MGADAESILASEEGNWRFALHAKSGLADGEHGSKRQESPGGWLTFNLVALGVQVADHFLLQFP